VVNKGLIWLHDWKSRQSKTALSNRHYAVPDGWDDVTSVIDKFRGNAVLLKDYGAALSGAGGRIVISLFYFIALANALSVADFGLFATASATGIMLSRIVGFGFTSPLYRIATVKPRLIGVYGAGYLLFAGLSVPVFLTAALAAHQLFFAAELQFQTFLLIVATEAFLWRTLEVIVIANNGMNRFGKASFLVILGSLFRAIAAVAFALVATRTIANWALWYGAANLVGLIAGIVFFMPRARLRLALPLYRRHFADSLSVAAAEMLFYVQSELDKLLVLAIGGAETAGVYAIIMRLVDLTAIPIRTFNMMLVQKLMRSGDLLNSVKRRIGLEAGLFTVSTLGIASLAGFLHFFPFALGKNVAPLTGLLFSVLLVPGFRNLVEYHAELLYARRQTVLRAINLALLAGCKAILLSFIFTRGSATGLWLYDLNWGYGLIWAASLLLTYSAMRPRK
jgi:O-antigen/teichoic acid export membrane protein